MTDFCSGNINLGIIVQARLGSTRLPNKIVRDFQKNSSILDILLFRLNDPSLVKFKKVLATSNSLLDSNLKKYAIKYHCDFFQGSEDNVLQRFIESGQKFGFTHLLRVCADNPFLSVYYIIELVDEFLNKYKELDYISFRNSEGIPTIKTHLGFFTEIVSLEALIKVSKLTSEKLYTEHVTNYLYSNKNIFKVQLIPAPKCVFHRNDIRFTVDDEDDFNNLSKLYQMLGIEANDICKLIEFIDKEENASFKKVMMNGIKKYTK